MYLENFESNEDIISNYGGTSEQDLKGAKVLLAWYGYGSYRGSSLILYTKKGKLYEVNGSHCSCFGLEDQWSPVETSWKALAMRNISDEYDGSQEAQKELQKLVKKHTTKKRSKAS